MANTGLGLARGVNAARRSCGNLMGIMPALNSKLFGIHPNATIPQGAESPLPGTDARRRLAVVADFGFA
jgi:hypothetical protein